MSSTDSDRGVKLKKPRWKLLEANLNAMQKKKDLYLLNAKFYTPTESISDITKGLWVSLLA